MVDIFLKPFIKIPIQYTDVEYEVFTCGEHEQRVLMNFCPICGKEIKTEKKIRKYRICTLDIFNDDIFFDHIEGDYMYIFSNIKSKLKIDVSEGSITTITQELMESMISEFYEKHKEHIPYLEQYIGSKVKVEFGFLYLYI